jgi:hypothetical protein
MLGCPLERPESDEADLAAVTRATGGAMQQIHHPLAGVNLSRL